MFNLSCFADPGDQQPGNAPRYFSNLRTDGIQNIDVAFSKTFLVREGMKLEVRGEFFNAFNTKREGLRPRRRWPISIHTGVRETGWKVEGGRLSVHTGC